LEKVGKLLLRAAAAALGVSAYLIACETELAPQHLSVAGKLPDGWLHWQVPLLAGILLFAARDLLLDLRCATCGARQRLSLGRVLLGRKLLCRACREQEAAAKQPQAEASDSMSAEYAELFEALK
jgi:hypothetical protein